MEITSVLQTMSMMTCPYFLTSKAPICLSVGFCILISDVQVLLTRLVNIRFDYMVKEKIALKLFTKNDANIAFVSVRVYNCSTTGKQIRRDEESKQNCE